MSLSTNKQKNTLQIIDSVYSCYSRAKEQLQASSLSDVRYCTKYKEYAHWYDVLVEYCNYIGVRFTENKLLLTL